EVVRALRAELRGELHTPDVGELPDVEANAEPRVAGGLAETSSVGGLKRVLVDVRVDEARELARRDLANERARRRDVSIAVRFVGRERVEGEKRRNHARKVRSGRSARDRAELLELELGDEAVAALHLDGRHA